MPLLDLSQAEINKKIKDLKKIKNDNYDLIISDYEPLSAYLAKKWEKTSIGIAHHKVIHLLSIYEGITVSELLKKLKVTKQSLNRILKDLIKLDIIIFKKDEQDTRIKHVFLNDKGKKIFNKDPPRIIVSAITKEPGRA